MELTGLIENIDIVDYISQYVELEERGEEYWGLSPFNEEKTPSFSVRRETGDFFDFSSGIGGNVFTFVRFFNKCTPPEAVNILREYAESEGHDMEIGKRLSATRSYRKFLPKQKKKKVAGISNKYDESYMENFSEDEEKLAEWIHEGISRESLNWFGVKYDPQSNRIIYPIRDLNGTIVNIGGRTIDPDWKEKGLRKYTYFSRWGTMNLVYGLYENMEHIQKKKEVIIFEGVKSVMLAHTWGVYNCACLLTSHLSAVQARILASQGVNVLFYLDKEINVYADHNIKKLRSFANVFYYKDDKNYLEPKDAPVDKGKEIFLELYNNKKRMI